VNLIGAGRFRGCRDLGAHVFASCNAALDITA